MAAISFRGAYTFALTHGFVQTSDFHFHLYVQTWTLIRSLLGYRRDIKHNLPEPFCLPFSSVFCYGGNALYFIKLSYLGRHLSPCISFAGQSQFSPGITPSEVLFFSYESYCLVSRPLPYFTCLHIHFQFLRIALSMFYYHQDRKYEPVTLRSSISFIYVGDQGTK